MGVYTVLLVILMNTFALLTYNTIKQHVLTSAMSDYEVER